MLRVLLQAEVEQALRLLHLAQLHAQSAQGEEVVRLPPDAQRLLQAVNRGVEVASRAVRVAQVVPQRRIVWVHLHALHQPLDGCRHAAVPAAAALLGPCSPPVLAAREQPGSRPGAKRAPPPRECRSHPPGRAAHSPVEERSQGRVWGWRLAAGLCLYQGVTDRMHLVRLVTPQRCAAQ